MEQDHVFPPKTWDKMAAYLRGIPASVGTRPKAVLVVSGHWDAEVPTVSTAARHSLLYDYYGFPEHTYKLTYPAPGDPDLADCVRDLLGKAGITSQRDHQRGLDHGVFIPFLLIYPNADIPIVQLSLRSDLDAAAHIAIGRALQPLREKGILIVGSGMSFHNMRSFKSPGEGDAEAAAFDQWLTAAATDSTPAVRNEKLSAWTAAPGALMSHPDPDHLLPLHVVAGAAGADAGRHIYQDQIFGKAISAYQFG